MATTQDVTHQTARTCGNIACRWLVSSAWVPLFHPKNYAPVRTLGRAIDAMPFAYAALLHVSAVQWLAPYLVSIGTRSALSGTCALFAS